MSALKKRMPNRTGFTIVELLIVIVVIAILAAISIVAYTGIQARANDSRVKSGVNQFEKALQLWMADRSPPIHGGSGSTVAVSNGSCSNGSSGWVATGIYTCSVEDALVSAGNLPSGFIRALPRNTHLSSSTDGRNAIMLYACGASNGRYALYWTLQNPSSQETAGFDSVRSTCSHGVDIRDNYGMRAGKLLQF